MTRTPDVLPSTDATLPHDVSPPSDGTLTPRPTPSLDVPLSPAALLANAADALDRVRAQTPLVQAITNSVVTGFTANVLLAVGAAPAMVDLVDEAGPFATVASGLLVNIGTPTPEQRLASIEAATSAGAHATPWVLDPVAVGSLPIRTALAHELVALRPTVIRGNASEILALAGSGAGGRGVDAADDVESALPAARALAERCGAVIAVSGPVDLITDGTQVIRLANGDPLLTKVTGGGCALGAVMAAFVGSGGDPLAQVVAAATSYAVAAELAAARVSGPGSFAVAFLDALAEVSADDVRHRGRIS